MFRPGVGAKIGIAELPFPREAFISFCLLLILCSGSLLAMCTSCDWFLFISYKTFLNIFTCHMFLLLRVKIVRIACVSINVLCKVAGRAPHNEAHRPNTQTHYMHHALYCALCRPNTEMILNSSIGVGHRPQKAVNAMLEL